MSGLTNGVTRDAHPAHARARDGETWRLEPHCCRVCFARIASTKLEHGGRLYVCTNCGLEGEGKPSSVCACGIKLRKARADGRSGEAMIDAGVRCHENPEPSPANPSRYVASYVEQAGEL